MSHQNVNALLTRHSRKIINARNRTYYFDAEKKCKNENSIMVSTLEPEFSPLHVQKLKEYESYCMIKE